MTAATYEPTDHEVVEACRTAFTDRAEIEAAGYVPGWHGEPALPGERCVVYGHGGWRQAIVTKVTPKTVHAVFTTPGAMSENERIRAQYLALSTMSKNAASVAELERGNLSYFRSVIAGTSPYTVSDAQMAAYRSYVDEPDYVGRKVEEYRAGRLASRERAQSDPYAYLNVTKGSGDRTGARTNLYVQPREA